MRECERDRDRERDLERDLERGDRGDLGERDLERRLGESLPAYNSLYPL